MRFPLPNYVTQPEIDAVVNAMTNDQMSPYISGKILAGPQVTRFEREFVNYLDPKGYAVAMNSCSSALHAALRALGVKPGDEVIVPSYTFTATAACVLQCGAVPVFADIERETFALDVRSVYKQITDKTVGIILVHLLGYPARDTVQIMNLASESDIFFIEDCAQALGAEYNGAKVGTFSDIATFSFGESKQLTTLGEGGIAYTKCKALHNKLGMLRNHGELTDNNAYTPKMLGYNYRLTEPAAAMGIVQMSRIDAINYRRKRNAEYLTMCLHDHDIWCTPKRVEGRVYSMYDLWYPLDDRNQVVEKLNEYLGDNIFYHGYPQPLYATPLFRPYKPPLSERTNTQWCCNHALWTSRVYPPLNSDHMDRMVEAIYQVVKY